MGLVRGGLGKGGSARRYRCRGFYRLPILVILAGTALSLLAAYLASSAYEATARLQFRTDVLSATGAIRQRMEAYIALLRGGAALFAAQDQVTAEDFHQYVERLRIREFYPGMQGYGFSQLVQDGDLDELVRDLRAQGLADVTYREDEPVDEKHLIAYLEPRDARNRAAMGYNMFSHPVRREAMARARRLAAPAASGPVILKQEINEEKQVGFLVYMPVYRGNGVPASKEDRERLFRGYVYSPFRSGDLLSQIIVGDLRKRLKFAIYDSEVAEDRLLYRQGPAMDTATPFQRTEPLVIAGRPWKVRFWPTPHAVSGMGTDYSGWALGIGLLVTVVLFGFSSAEARSRARAQSELIVRQRAERELSISERRFRTMVEESPLGIQVFAPDGSMLGANRALLEMWDLREEDLVDYNVLKDPQIQRRRVVEELKRAFSGEVAAIPPVYYELPDKSMAKWVSTIAYPLKDEDGTLREVVLIYQDLTDVKKAEEAMRSLNNLLEQRVEERTVELQRAMEEMESFSYTVAHDLRAPLRAMGGYSRMLEEDFAESLKEPGRDYLHRIRENSYRMGLMIDGLLALARISRLELNSEPVDLSVLAHEILDGLQRRNPERRVQAAIDKDMMAHGDERLLHLVLQNLIENAWKFTTNRDLAKIQVGSRDEGERTVFFVTDNGVGYSKEHERKLFGPFERLHAPGEFPGTGIGLATVKRIVERHGGSVWAEGEVGVGATFSFSLPKEAG